MRIIDARSGRDLKVGDHVQFDRPEVSYTLLEVRDLFFVAKARYRLDTGEERWGPLAVRFTHPSFFLQRVAFVPS